MKVSIDMSPEYREPYAIIRTDKMTEEIQRIADLLGGTGIPVAAVKNSGDIAILQNSEICMVRIESGCAVIYGKNEKYRSNKKLYELLEQLGPDFMQISKSAIVNMRHIDSLETGFSGADTSENEKRLQRIYFKKISEGFQEATRAVKHGIGL